MNRNHLSHLARTMFFVGVGMGLSSGAFASCSSSIAANTATVTCTSASDSVTLGQYNGLWYHTGLSTWGDGAFDWDDFFAGDQNLPAGGTVDVANLGGGLLTIGDLDYLPADALTGIVIVGNSGGTTANVVFDSRLSSTASTYQVDDGVSYNTTVNSLTFHDNSVTGENLYIATGSAADTVNILSVYGSDSVHTISSGGGDDLVNIGSAGSAQLIKGWVQVSNDTSTNSSTLTTLTIDDSADTTARSIIYSETTISGLAPANIYLDTGVTNNTLSLGTGADMIEVQSTGAGSGALTIHGTAGNDVVSIGDAGSAQGILTPVKIDNNGVNSFTNLTIDNSADATARSVSFMANNITGAAPGSVSWTSTDVSFVTLNLGTDDDTVHVFGTPSNVSGPHSTISLGAGNNQCFIKGSGLGNGSVNVIFAGAGDDLFVVSAVQPGISSLDIFGGSQLNGDELIYTGGPASGAFPGNGVLTPIDSAAHPINYNSIEKFDINDTIFREPFE